MTTQSANTLISNLEAQSSGYQTLHHLLCDEYEIMRNKNLDQFQQCIIDKANLLSTLDHLEQERKQTTEQLAKEIGMQKQEHYQLRTIIERLDPVTRKKLSQLRETLIHSANEVSEQQQRNRSFAEKINLLNRQQLNVIQKSNGERITYGQKGSMLQKGRTGRMLNRGI